MIRYANLSGDSGVREYEIGPGYIKVRFGGGPIYAYDNSRPGAGHVAIMQRLAQAGKGLATYISQNVKKSFARKE